ncbi:hypothetical protein PBI_BUTTERS_43 [Mycobacterium phage Butters]|uniref:Uncharacterized protein n=2 Tax=Charlievirus butters TaxID=2169798 RepID=A0A2Z5HFQ3_9CAUD|nr:hypothetical protein K768_gp43 [Mycobacterium phage Butters]AGI12990.1 hypothetical protein PBI_BUTTERS_43 [Mycobacterium phage Butters]AXC38527.1 hypothetical protein SEA_RUBEELU_43 [Mycobacterium phage Rubeelu]
MGTSDRIAEHHKKWAALPPFPAWPYVTTDENVQAWGDILYMRGLADAIEALVTPTAAHDVLAGFERDGRGLIDADAEIHLDVQWPADLAAELIDAWRNEAVAA